MTRQYNATTIIPSCQDGILFYIIMKYIFNRKGKPEEVKLERWVWGVIYKNDTEFHQFGKKGDFHQIKEINWKEVKMFTMYKSEDINKRIDLLVLPDMQVFHFYRNVRPAGQDKFIKVYVFGYKTRGSSETVYNFILPDDRVLISNKDNVDLTRFELNRK